MNSCQKVKFEDLGQISFDQAWEKQEKLLGDLISQKREQRDSRFDQRKPPIHRLLYCEHPPVYTMGKTGKAQHLLLSESLLKAKGIEFYKINRGGDITFHGPGQIVGYPILDLDWFFTDIHRYIRTIEEIIIRTIAEYGLDGIRMKGYTGVWLPASQNKPFRKICAIGVHLSRWVTMHGFAFNVNTNLDFFQYIVPCGISDTNKVVTTLSRELGEQIDIKEVKEKTLKHFSDLFECEFV